MQDRLCLRETTNRPNVAVAWVLMAAYLYYQRDEGLISDAVYDALTAQVRGNWDSITHPHKAVLEAIVGAKSGTLFDVRADSYPLICRSAACRLVGIPLE